MTSHHPADLQPSRDHRGGATSRSCLAAVVAVAALLGVVVGWAPAAGAHAVLSTSTPAEGERLPTGPSSVTLSFTEPVSLGLGGVSVLDRTGARMDRGATEQPAPNRIRAELQPDLADGTYLISYRVTSADGHVVSGGVMFAVGDVLDAAAVAGLSAATDPATTWAGLLGRLALFGGVLVAVGLSLFLRFSHDGEPDGDRLAHGVRLAAAVGALGALAHVATRAAEATGRGLGVATDTDVISQVLRQGGLGWWLVGVLGGLAVILVGTGVRRSAAGQALVLYGCLVTVGAFALTGHLAPDSAGWLLAAADAVHVGVAAIWVGGLVGMLAVLRWRHHGPVNATAAHLSAGTADIVVRVSTTAALSVAVLWATGLAQAWWTVGDWSALTTSDYGRTLMVKLGLVVATMGIAGWNRYRLVPGLLDDQDHLDAALVPDAPTDTGLTNEPYSTDGATTLVAPAPAGPAMVEARPPAWSRLLRTVRIEAVVLVAVLAVTAVLVQTPPARTDLAGPQPFNETLPVQAGLDVNLAAVPGTVGRNELHITYITADGSLFDGIESATLEMTLPAQGVGPLTANGSRVGPGHYVVVTEQIAVAGTWRLDVVSRIGAFEQRRTAFDVPIAG
jgi:copper transport protein